MNTSNETTAGSGDDDAGDIALRHALGTLDDAERAAYEKCQACVNRHAIALEAEYCDAVAGTTIAMLPTQQPPPEMKERVAAAVRSHQAMPATPPHAPAMIMAANDLPWMSTPYRGVRIREMSTASPDYSILMLSCDPGTSFPPHDHAGSEDVYILSGDACIDGRVLRAGDYMHAEPGSHHEDMLSPSGCQALLITSRKNYSPHAARAYHIAHRVVKRIGKAFGVTVRD